MRGIFFILTVSVFVMYKFTNWPLRKCRVILIYGKLLVDAGRAERTNASS